MSAMSLVFSDENGVCCDVHPDWMGFGVTDYSFQGELDPIFQHLPMMTYVEGGRHHNHMFKSDCVTICYDAKLATKDGKLREFTNYNLEIELTGKYFCDYDVYALFKTIFDAGGKVRFFRVDAALDYYGAIEYRLPYICRRGGRGKYRDDFCPLDVDEIAGHDQEIFVDVVGGQRYRQRWQGFSFGLHDRRVRLYDKAYQQKEKDPHKRWWRYEIMLRGDKVRDAFGWEPRQFSADDLMTIICDVLANKNNVACYDTQFADLAAKISCRDIVVTKKPKSKYKTAEQNLVDFVKDKIKKFQHLWRKVASAANVHNVVAAFLRAPVSPPRLLGGDELSTPICYSWDELCHEMSIIEKKLQKNNEILMST